MFHGDRAPEAELRRAAPGNWKPRHRDRVTVVEIVAQEGGRAMIVLVREQDLGAVEFDVVEQPGAHARQVSDGLDVIIAPPGEQPHPPATRRLAEHKSPVRLDQGGAVHRQQSLHARMTAPLADSCNAAMSERCRYFDTGPEDVACSNRAPSVRRPAAAIPILLPGAKVRRPRAARSPAP